MFKNYFNEKGFHLYRFKDNKLIGALEGPPQTFYENSFFLFEMTFPWEYPIIPPEFKFITKIFHPNIREIDGLVSVDILRDKWSPFEAIDRIVSIIISIQSLLDAPNPHDFLNETVAKLYIEDLHKYENRVRLYTAQFPNYENLKKLISNFDFKVEYNESCSKKL